MKNIVFFILTGLCLLVCNAMVNAQTKTQIIRKQGASVNLYNDAAAAFSSAVNGDTIYLPGGSMNIGTLTINKSLHVFGVGHYPDSTLATGYTNLNGSIILQTGASNTELCGFYLNGDTKCGTSAGNQTVSNIHIYRCNINNLYLSFDGSTNTLGTYFTIDENIIRGTLGGGFAQQVFISKNIFNFHISNFNQNAFIKNNLFVLQNWDDNIFFNITSCDFENNIICQLSYRYGGIVSSSTGNTFKNNLFFGATNLGTNNSINNLFSQSINFTTFKTPFDYNANYHLKAGCLGIGFGTDGTDVGIYGTKDEFGNSTPYKEGAIPPIPHLQAQNIISTGTAGNQTLNINIRVQAQGN